MPSGLIRRYDSTESVGTYIDPLQDVLNWISGLNSKGYVEDVLRQKHRMTSARKLNRAADAITTFAGNALGLIEQAFSGPAEVSFLPLYYAILNLSKIYIVASGRLSELDNHRYHGASYNPTGKDSRDLLTEEITLRRHGVLCLLYEVLTGENWRWNRKRFRMSDIYPYIEGLTHEYWHAYGKRPNLAFINLSIHSVESDKYQVTATIWPVIPIANQRNNSYLKVLKSGFRQSDSDQNVFEGPTASSQDIDEAKDRLLGNVRRELLYKEFERENYFGLGRYQLHTPVSNRHFLFPEEIPIWLAFFHLSSVVRYKPEFVHKVRQSKSWPMVLALGRQSMFRYLILFWSFFHQSVYDLTTD